MADLDDITSLILKAQATEISNPQKAYARYEGAERGLDNYLLSVLGISRDILARKPENPLSKRFLPYYDEIMSGYSRLNESKERIRLIRPRGFPEPDKAPKSDYASSL